MKSHISLLIATALLMCTVHNVHGSAHTDSKSNVEKLTHKTIPSWPSNSMQRILWGTDVDDADHAWGGQNYKKQSPDQRYAYLIGILDKTPDLINIPIGGESLSPIYILDIADREKNQKLIDELKKRGAKSYYLGPVARAIQHKIQQLENDVEYVGYEIAQQEIMIAQHKAKRPTMLTELADLDRKMQELTKRQDGICQEILKLRATKKTV